MEAIHEIDDEIIATPAASIAAMHVKILALQHDVGKGGKTRDRTMMASLIAAAERLASGALPTLR